MFNQVSWAAYLTVILVLLVIYYLFLGIKFFSKELLSFLGDRRDPSGNRVYKEDEKNQQEDARLEQRYSDVFQSHNKNTVSSEDIDNTFQQVEKLTAATKQIIADAALNNTIREELMLSLQSVLKKYHHLKASPFLIAVNNLITSECDKYNLTHLNAEELAMIWD